MRRQLLAGGILAAAVGAVVLTLLSRAGTEAAGGKAGAKQENIAHMVYFSLKDNSPKAKAKLIEACKKYLSKHPGTVYFSAGTLAEEYKRPVNDRDFDVALHLVFKDRAAHDAYQDAPLHKQLIEENKDNWKKVRVFDAAVQP